MLAATACSDDKDDHDHDHDAGSGGASGSGGSGTGGSGTGGSGTGGSGTGGVPEAGTSTFALKFRAKVGTQPFACDSTYMGLGATATVMAPQDFRFYIHEVRLIAAGGAQTPLALSADGKWQTDQVALVDFETNTGTCTNGTTDTNDTVTGMATSGTYTGVVFKIGVPEALNHLNPAKAASPLNLTAMAWDWTYGYKFMKLDVGVHMPMPEGGMPMDGGGGDAAPADTGGGGGHVHDADHHPPPRADAA
ncbi:MAG: metallo-mystery pair system four-Cys motif protein, partial [Deltaproteobacteria bacterium]|nr:metallo-mystery pair system four-Cys motif protein [Deltaproteobacteria bacterium]